MPASRPRQGRAVTDLQLLSTLTCPECRHQASETMPTTACQFFYECPGCGVVMRPKQGDCCVFCSYGIVPCPTIQQQKPCCGQPLVMSARYMRGSSRSQAHKSDL